MAKPKSVLNALPAIAAQYQRILRNRTINILTGREHAALKISVCVMLK